MRTSGWWSIVVLLSLAAGGQNTRIDPERMLSERFGFSDAEVTRARQGQPVVRVQADSQELVVGGAIRLAGRKERLSDWLRNIEHFRNSAQLGTTHVIPSPPSAAAFAGVTLDAADLAELKQCSAGPCDVRLSAEALGRLQRDSSQAEDIVRQMLGGYTKAYMNGGHAGIAAFDGPHARTTFADDMRQLIGRATALTALAPDLVAFLDRYPAATLPGSDQLFYWSSMPAGSSSILSVHHLIVYRPAASEVWIADKSIYASRHIDAGLLAIGLYDAADGGGFYAVAGSRMMASQLGGVAATVLRRQVERSASDTVKMYLEWIRDSLAQAPGQDR